MKFHTKFAPKGSHMRNFLASLIICLPLFCNFASASVGLEEVRNVASKFQTKFASEHKLVKKSKLSIDVWKNDKSLSPWATIFGSTSRPSSQIVIPGAFINLPEVTLDILIVVLCHEMGHPLGGSPNKTTGPNRFSIEGQADYWAGAKCIPNIFADEPETYDIQLNETEEAYILCRTRTDDLKELKVCVRSLRAIHDNIVMYNRKFVERELLLIRNSGLTSKLALDFIDKYDRPVPRFDTPDLSVVAETNTTEIDHPNLQCRLDTLVAGYFKTDRPACWFKP